MGTGQKHKKVMKSERRDHFLLSTKNTMARFTTCSGKIQAKSPDTEILPTVEEAKCHCTLQQVFSQAVKRVEVLGAGMGWDALKMC